MSLSKNEINRRYRERHRDVINEIRRVRRSILTPERPVRKSSKIDKECIVCGDRFLVFPSLDRVQCCSRKCSRVIVAAQLKGKPLFPRVRLCLGCGNVALIKVAAMCVHCWRDEARTKHTHRVKDERYYKSTRASGLAKYERIKSDPERHEAFKQRMLEYSSRRRARTHSTRVHRISYARIVQEHGMVCHICNLPIERPQLSFDHVIPLSRGGYHVEENIKPAHIVCNKRKSSRLMTEFVWPL